MADKRFTNNPHLTALAGTEVIPATSIAGGIDTGGNPVAAGTDIGISVHEVLAAARAIEVISAIAGGTITPTGTTDLARPAALTAALTIANPSSTPVDGAGFVLDLIDNGTSRALTWGSKYANRMATLPAATIAGKRHRIGVEYNATDDKLYCMYVQVQP